MHVNFERGGVEAAEDGFSFEEEHEDFRAFTGVWSHYSRVHFAFFRLVDRGKMENSVKTNDL